MASRSISVDISAVWKLELVMKFRCDQFDNIMRGTTLPFKRMSVERRTTLRLFVTLRHTDVVTLRGTAAKDAG